MLNRIVSLGVVLLVTITSVAHAKPSQDEVFKSISSNMDQSVDGTKVLAFFAAAAGLVIVLVVVNRRRQIQAAPKALNNPSKLLKELSKTAGLKSGQVKQLKVLGEDLSARNEGVENLVTLLLCPSLIQQRPE